MRRTSLTASEMNPNINNDSICIRGLRLKCHIGVSPRERKKKQTIITDIALKCDLRRAGKSDCLGDTCDYSKIVKGVTVLAAEETFCLLETLAEQIVKTCLADSKVNKVTVKVAKIGVLSNVRSVEVEITRNRDFTVCHSRPDSPRRSLPPSRLGKAPLRRDDGRRSLGRESRNSEETGFPLSLADARAGAGMTGIICDGKFQRRVNHAYL
ncbi:MAG: dihydroneopterin aldolase [Kiritimatiellia bacterium]|nr:dihydroneopterin aldolase [Kiritimatiellia bacterium]